MAASFTAAELDDPLIKTLPPATDYLTYLTILEYQLTPARLPLLHKILQDQDLTINIGWDLVQLLVPLLPASEECLLDIARLGNPREVVLRVAESLSNLESSKLTEAQELADQDDAGSNDSYEEEVNAAGDTAKHEQKEEGMDVLPIHEARFNTLISMLAILQPRIKTQYPSRFLATSIDAALRAFELNTAASTTESLLSFIRSVSPRKRPALPPRRSSVGASTQLAPGAQTNPDPEADSSDKSPSAEENSVFLRLLQYALIDVLRGYVASLAHVEPPGMFWTARWSEKSARGGSGLHQTSFLDLFAAEEGLVERDHVVGHIAALSRDLGMTYQELLTTASSLEVEPYVLDADKIPETAAAIQLSPFGCALLLAARRAGPMLFSSTQIDAAMPLMPDFGVMLNNYMEWLGENPGAWDWQVGSEPDAVIDSLLFLGSSSVWDPFPTFENVEETAALLNSFTSIAAQSPNPFHVSHAKQLAGQYFGSIPSTKWRMEILKDQLLTSDGFGGRELPLQWWKDEILNGGRSKTTVGSSDSTDAYEARQSEHFTSVFDLVFDNSVPDNTATDSIALPDALMFANIGLGLCRAKLNVYYVFMRSSDVKVLLESEQLKTKFQTEFLAPLKQYLSQTKSIIGEKTGDSGNGGLEASLISTAIAEIMFTEDAIQSVETVGAGKD